MNVKLATQLLSQSTVEMIRHATSNRASCSACTIKACTVMSRIFVRIGILLLIHAMVRTDCTHSRYQMQLNDKLDCWVRLYGFLDGRNYMMR
jgi:hypothetical protein